MQHDRSTHRLWPAHYYGKSHILHGVSLDVAEGRITALLGRNGAGKTTTLRRWARLLKLMARGEKEAQSAMAEKHKAEWRVVVGRATGILVLLTGILLAAGLCTATPQPDNPIPSIFQPHSTPADSIFHLSLFVLGITALIFLVLLCY